VGPVGTAVLDQPVYSTKKKIIHQFRISIILVPRLLQLFYLLVPVLHNSEFQ
jgi:hypothetical protein